MACNVAVFFAAIDVIFLRIYCIAFHLMLYQNPQGDYVICNIRKLRRIIMKNGIEILMCIVSYAYVGALAQETSNGGIKHSSSAPSLRWYVQTPGHFVNSSYVSSSDDEDNQVKDNSTAFRSGLPRSMHMSSTDLQRYLAEEKKEDDANGSSHVGESAFSGKDERDSDLGLSTAHQARQPQTTNPHIAWIEQKQPISHSLSYHFGNHFAGTKQHIKQYCDALRMFHTMSENLKVQYNCLKYTSIDIYLPSNRIMMILKYCYAYPNDGLTVHCIKTMFSMSDGNVFDIIKLPPQKKIRFVDKPRNNENILRVMDLLEDNILKILHGESSCLTEMSIVSKYGETVRDFYEKPQISTFQIKR